MKENKKVTLKTLAEQLGMTPAAVSKALNGKKDISVATQTKVKQLAEELGYRPNLIARGLVNQRSGMIGIMIADLRISYFAQVVRGIYENARRHNLTPILMINEEDPEREKSNLEILASIQVDGILIHPTPGENNLDTFEQLQNEGMQLISYDRTIHDSNISSVTIDDYKSGYAVTEALIKDGCRSFKLIGLDESLPLTVERIDGMKKALTDHNIALDDGSVIRAPLDFDVAYERAREMFLNSRDVDAVICAGGLVAHATARAGMDLDRNLLKHIKIAEFGNNNVLHRLGIPFFTVDQSPMEIGKAAIDELVSRMANPKLRTLKHIKVPSTIIEYNKKQEGKELMKVK